MYKRLEKNIAGPNYNLIWMAKLPLKIKKFLWQAMYNAILTRDNMKKGNGLVIQLVLIVITMRVGITYFLFALLQSLCGVSLEQCFILILVPNQCGNA